MIGLLSLCRYVLIVLKLLPMSPNRCYLSIRSIQNQFGGGVFVIACGGLIKLDRKMTYLRGMECVLPDPYPEQSEWEAIFNL
jgi:hypothetical protein